MTAGLPSLSSSLGSLGTPSPQGDGGYDANGVMRVRGQRPRQYPTGQPPQPQQTFAQMQQQGIARPAPQPYQPAPQQQQFTGQLQGAVSNALQTPSRYDLPQVQQVRDALTSQLQQQFNAQRQQLDEQNARRGLLSSSIGAGYQGDLAGQQANALASMNAGLIQDAAANNAADRNSALSAGQNFQTQTANQGLDAAKFGQSQYDSGADRALSAAQSAGNLSLGLGNLGVNQQQANTQQAGTMGNLGLGQGQLSLAQLQNLQQYGLQGAQLSLQQQKQLQDYALGQGQLGVSQEQANTQRDLGFGNLNLGQQQLAQSGSQFNVQQALAEKLGLGNLGLQQGQLDLSRQLGLGNLNLDQQRVGNQASQFGQTYNLEQNAQQNQQQQFAQQLAQQLGLATMGDKTANRGIDVQGQLANSDLILKIAQLLGLPTGTTGSTLGGGTTTGTGSAGTGTGTAGGLGGGTGTTGGVGGNSGDGSDPLGKGGVVGGQQKSALSPELIQQLLRGGGPTPYSFLDPAYGGAQ